VDVFVILILNIPFVRGVELYVLLLFSCLFSYLKINFFNIILENETLSDIVYSSSVEDNIDRYKIN